MVFRGKLYVISIFLCVIVLQKYITKKAKEFKHTFSLLLHE
jgi:hypothetical protein